MVELFFHPRPYKAFSSRLAPLVAMVQSAHARQRQDLCLTLRSRRDGSFVWRVLGQSQMTTVLVMVANVRAYEPEEVAMTGDDYVIQEFPAATAEPTLRHKRRV